MYARSTTFRGRPSNIEAGIAFVKNEVQPMLDDIEGCRGLSMLVDRETGHCIVTSSWETEAAMRASDAQLRPIRERGRDILGGDMEMDEWEVVVMHRASHGECCRVSWLQGDLDALSESFRFGILPDLEQTDGFCSASLLANRATGLGCATTAWATAGSSREDSRCGPATCWTSRWPPTPAVPASGVGSARPPAPDPGR